MHRLVSDLAPQTFERDAEESSDHHRGDDDDPVDSVLTGVMQTLAALLRRMS